MHACTYTHTAYTVCTHSYLHPLPMLKLATLGPLWTGHNYMRYRRIVVIVKFSNSELEIMSGHSGNDVVIWHVQTNTS